MSASFATANLPQWTEDDIKRLDSGRLVVGKALLTLEGDPTLVDPNSPENTIEDNSVTPRDLPPSRPIVIAPTIIHPTPPLVDDRVALNSSLVNRYFKNPISAGLFDPQQILSTQARLDIEYALSTLADESPIPVYFYLFDRGQKVIQNYSPKTIFDTHYYADASAIMIYYFVEEPERCQIYFGGKDAQNVKPHEIRELISGVRAGAKKRSNSISQLDEFIRQLSLQLYWIEKSLLEETFVEEIDAENKKSSSGNTKFDKIIVGYKAFASNWWKVATACGGFISLLLAGVYYVKHRKFRFPHLKTQTRLNLPNGGGMGGILSYKNQNLPPSAQKEQFDDIL